jgi:rubrerythrin
VSDKKNVFEILTELFNKYNFESGTELEKHKQEFIDKVKENNIEFTIELYDELEDNNYHTANEILEEEFNDDVQWFELDRLKKTLSEVLCSDELYSTFYYLSEYKRLKQKELDDKKIFCYSCESISAECNKDNECPKCFSGHWDLEKDMVD